MSPAYRIVIYETGPGATEWWIEGQKNISRFCKADYYVPSITYKMPQLKKCLVKDNLTTHLKLTLFGQNLTSSVEEDEAEVRKMVERSREKICNNLALLLETGQRSDFIIRVKKQADSPDKEDEYAEIKVHKLILGAQSPVLNAMLEAPMQEKATGHVILQDLSEDCVNLMLRWMYSGTLDDFGGWKKVPEEMVRAADKYGLTLLLEWLDKRMIQACDLENATRLLKMAKLHGLATASANITDFIKANVGKIEY